MLEDRSIEVWAYNLETVLAEKLETVITRTVINTRMRDFYDIHILLELHGERLDGRVLQQALQATASKRGTGANLNNAALVFNEVERDATMQKLWNAYQKKFSYASAVSSARDADQAVAAEKYDVWFNLSEWGPCALYITLNPETVDVDSVQKTIESICKEHRILFQNLPQP